MMNRKAIYILSVFLLIGSRGFSQLSPGELSTAHTGLEGLSNCTQCHVLGNKVSNDKCLACHTELASRITARKGYHSSVSVEGKQCSECHSEHNGKNFKLIRFDLAKFDHSLTGYKLSEPHSKQDCRVCHTATHITDPVLKQKKNTYLGVGTACLNCHADYHLKTLSSDCSQCHTDNAFTPAAKFSHDNARFRLAGKHKTVDCQKCHKVTITDGKKFQQFRGLQYSNCTSCHKDPHQNQFGQNCRQCHSEESFQVVSGLKDFDHNKTAFKLEDKHLIVSCKACHKGKLTDPLKHDLCTDCHTDYHNGQFKKNGLLPDCSECHSVKGFTGFSFTLDKHNTGPFPLKGAHLAVPCNDCHRKQDKWSFRQIGVVCSDCHTDIHRNLIDTRFYPSSNCTVCHKENSWSSVTFDHSKTNFSLTGGHSALSCRACHFKTNAGVTDQKFKGLQQTCASCHKDNHFGQFEKNGKTECTECHDTQTWKPVKFNHDNTAFRLDGKHINVACNKCHKPETTGGITYTKYKLKEFKCESCHF